MVIMQQMGGEKSRKLKGNVIAFMQASEGQQIAFKIVQLEETLRKSSIVHLQSPFKPADLQDFNDKL
jgi:hypothetical protein